MQVCLHGLFCFCGNGELPAAVSFAGLRRFPVLCWRFLGLGEPLSVCAAITSPVRRNRIVIAAQWQDLCAAIATPLCRKGEAFGVMGCFASGRKPCCWWQVYI